MLSLMREIEAAFLWLGKVVSKVVDAKDAQKKTKWSSEAEIAIMAKVFATPKKMRMGNLWLNKRQSSEKSAKT